MNRKRLLAMLLSLVLLLTLTPAAAFAEEPEEEEAGLIELVTDPEPENAPEEPLGPHIVSGILRESDSLETAKRGLSADGTNETSDTRYTVSVTGIYGQSGARSMLPMINELRTGDDAWYRDEDENKVYLSDLGTLQYSYALEEIAMQRAIEVALSFSHTRPNGESCFTCVASNGSQSWGENIAAGYNSMSTAAEAFESWCETDEPYDGQGHRRNMLESGFKCVGIAHVTVGKSHYWVQEFSRYNPTGSSCEPLDGEKTCSVEVSSTRISSYGAAQLDPSSLSLKVNATAALPRAGSVLTIQNAWYSQAPTAWITPAWQSGSSAVASITNGKVKGVGVGQTALSAVAFNAQELSVPVTVTAELPSITTQPKSVSVSEGSTATFTVAATGASAYQWQWSKDGTTWNDSSSATVGYNTASLQVTASASRNGYQYRCKVSNSAGSVTSNAATLTVTAAKPVITAQPQSVSVSEGAAATFSVTATGASSYQWQWSKDGGATWNNSSSATAGYNTATLQVTASASRNGYQYRCKLTNNAGTTISSAATLTVTAAKPVITVQPKSVSVSEGSTAAFTVTATGASSYQWQWSKDGGTTWNNSSSATVGYNTATLQVTASASRNGYQYRCKVSNSAGSVTSNAATLTVTAAKPVITGQPKSLSVSAGSTAAFTVTATGASSYQWQWSKDGGTTWNNSSSATVGYNTDTLQVTATAARSGYRYRCKVSNSAGTTISSAATLTVISKPVITAQPQSVSVSAGSTAAFTVTATGASSYQWQWSKDGGKTWNNSSSATVGYNTATLQVTASASRNGYQYRCKVTNSAGTTISGAATLTVR